jgi:ubiquinone/menaquinone biosynthesis C-methylase UbiE
MIQHKENTIKKLELRKEVNMEVKEKEEVRQAVRERYGKIAKADDKAPVSSQLSQAASCCGESNLTSETNSSSSCCGSSEFTMDRMAAAIGYTKEDLAGVPGGANLGLGCGNPVALASLKPGETVVDLGSGGGLDCFLAAQKVGETGKVIGVDMTPEMISKARKNAENMGVKNLEFRLGEIENLPIADNSADIIISNCVINLSPDKPGVYREALRVLKPGGRLVISDILTTEQLPDEIQKNRALVTACIGGAATIQDTEKMLKGTGFQDIKITPKNVNQELIREWIPGKKVEDYIVPAYIEAIKPS